MMQEDGEQIGRFKVRGLMRTGVGLQREIWSLGKPYRVFKVFTDPMPPGS